MQNQRKMRITFDTQVKTAFTKLVKMLVKRSEREQGRRHYYKGGSGSQFLKFVDVARCKEIKTPILVKIWIF